MKINIITNGISTLLVCTLLISSACKDNEDINPQNETSDSFTDSRDGTVYKTVSIGDQVWMAENLRYLPSVVPATEGSTSTSTPYYYVLGYNGTDVSAAKESPRFEDYGVWYNWAAAMEGAGSSNANPSGIQGACPDGWHIPSDEEWNELINYLANNGYNYDGSNGGEGEKIGKALADTISWRNSSIEGAVGNDDYPELRNKSGFSALPGGNRDADGYFSSLGETYNGTWWSSTEEGADRAYKLYISYARPRADKTTSNKAVGANCRCVKD
jgi:uncharacterized protein (TIGR02145 family)